MDLPKIRTFLEAAECLNFSEAAARLHTAQSNVSKQIAFLEQDLGVPLFTRTKGRISLTPAGEVLRREYSKAMDYVEQGRISARQCARGKPMSLRFGVFEGYAPQQYLTPMILAFEAAHPNVDLEFEWLRLPEIQARWGNGQTDFFLLKDFDASGLFKHQSVSLGAGTPSLLIHAKHPLAARPSLTLADVQDEPFVSIQPERHAGGHRFLIGSLRSAGLTPNIAYLAPDLQSLVNCVIMGRAVAIADMNYCYCKDPLLKGYPLSKLEPAKDLLVWHSDNPNPAIPLFLNASARLPGADLSAI